MSDRPSQLFKYQPFSARSVQNLANRQLFFARPVTFNDPFDCAIRIDTGAIPDEDFQALLRYTRSSTSDTSAFDARFITDGRANQLFRDHAVKGLAEAFETRRRIMLNERGVCCFSEKCDDVLMWAHYASGHTGFCLEFSTDRDPFVGAKRVSYQREIPSVNPASVLLRDVSEAFFAMIVTKFESWGYEREWRAFHKVADTLFTYLPEMLTGVYFGSAMAESQRSVIRKLLIGSPTLMYEMIRSEREFCLISRVLS